MGVVQRGGAWTAAAPPSPLLDVPNVTAHPSTASVPTSYYSMWHYNCLCIEHLYSPRMVEEIKEEEKWNIKQTNSDMA